MAKRGRKRQAFRNRGFVFRKMVRHPGAKAFPFIDNTKKAIDAQIQRNPFKLTKETQKNATVANVTKDMTVYFNRLIRFGLRTMQQELTRKPGKRSSGNLKKSLRSEQQGSNFLIIASGENGLKAQFLNKGTKPHIIRARRSSMLRFRATGRVG